MALASSMMGTGHAVPVASMVSSESTGDTYRCGGLCANGTAVTARRRKLLKLALSAILRSVALPNWGAVVIESNRRADCSAANEFRRQAQR